MAGCPGASAKVSSFGVHRSRSSRSRIIGVLMVAAAVFTGWCGLDRSPTAYLAVPEDSLKLPGKVPVSGAKLPPAEHKVAKKIEALWQLDDESVVDAFKVHEESQHGIDTDKLAVSHPFARDARMARFDSVAHTFFVVNPDGQEVKCRKGVTSLLKRFSQPFEPDDAIEKMRSSSRWETKQEEFRKEDGTIMSDEEIKAYWSFKGRVSSVRGSLLHEEIERHLNGYTPEGPHSPEFAYFLKFEEEMLENLQVWRTEAKLFHCGLRACGIADLLCRDEEGHLVIVDWKRSNKIVRSNPFQTMKFPVTHLDDCNFNHYSLQLNMYRYILESEYGEKVSRMLLVQLHPQFPSYVALEVARLDKELDEIVEHLYNLGEADDPMEGPDAVFEADW
mmetsp:Transcript_47472/g.87235  ORF Transcript_47472/g.87235 Transcript_47472/m.87235 type:complete len:390 (+) Transcript_47472:3-1172(+)